VTEEEAVRQYLALALRIVRRMRSDDPAEDESDAMLALLLAVRRFDPDKGMKLKSWLVAQVPRGIIDLRRLRWGRNERSPKRFRPAPFSVVFEPGQTSNFPTPDPDPSSSLTASDTFAEVSRIVGARNARILQLLINGYSQREAGEAVGLSESGISHVIAKMGERAQAGRLALALEA
jgi:RNA polymerase sigma factor (sigma-70 family)